MTKLIDYEVFCGITPAVKAADKGTLAPEFETNVDTLKQRLDKGDQLGKLVLSHLSGGSLSLTDLFGSIVKVSSTFLEGLIILVISGIYLAAQPRLYRDGLIQLFPPRLHRRIGMDLDGIAGAMRFSKR